MMGPEQTCEGKGYKNGRLLHLFSHEPIRYSWSSEGSGLSARDAMT